jgi:endoglucanase
VLHDTAPDLAFVNASENRALRLDNYTSTLQSIIKAFAYRQISVLISVDATTKAGTNISEEGYLHAIDKLTSSLCTSSYWNVLGLDLRSESGQNTTWGDGSATDFRAAATRIGNRMLQGCPSWLVFVRGIHESDDHLETGETYGFDAWSRGGGLSKTKEFPVTLSIPDKVVYAPHFYLPGVVPSANDVYTQRDSATELSDAELQETVRDAFDRMIGQLATEPERPAIVLSGFGGLYLEDKSSYRTSQRTVDYTVKLISEALGLIGGYAWALNPETSFTRHGQAAQEGLVTSDWRTANEPYLEALESLNEIPHLSATQCFPLNSSRR